MSASLQMLGGVVVTFHPDEEFEARLAAMAAEVDMLFVVDNSGDPAVERRLAAAASQRAVRVMTMPGNCGLGAALNAGIAELERRGVSGVVAFDQDSTPELGCVAALRQAAFARPRAGVIGSNWRDEARPDTPTLHLVRGVGVKPWFHREPATHDLDEVTFVITSGSFFRIETWREVGGFREDLFVDLVDTEYCLRTGARRWGIAVAAGAHLRHRRAQKRAVRWCGRTWWPAHMSPERLQLVVRNRVWTLARYGWTRWPWAFFEIAHTAFLLFSVLFLEGQTAAKLSASLRGAWDGLCGRLGAPAWAEATPTSASAEQTTPS